MIEQLAGAARGGVCRVEYGGQRGEPDPGCCMASSVVLCGVAGLAVVGLAAKCEGHVPVRLGTEEDADSDYVKKPYLCGSCGTGLPCC